MSGYVIPLLVALVLLVTAIAGAHWLAERLRPRQDGFRHKATSQHSRAKQDTSPWMRLQRTENGWQPAPVAKGPHFHHENPGVGLDTLERVRAGLLALPPLPDDPAPADTAEFPAVVNDMGLPSDNEEYINALFAKAEAEFGVLPDFRVAEKMAAAIMPGGVLP